MTNEEIRRRLFAMQDVKYRDFHGSLIPGVGGVIGVRVPQLRSFAGELRREGGCQDFLTRLPHDYYEENNLHAFLIQGIRDYSEYLREIRRFLPFIDNWATCDMLRPGVVKKHLPEYLEEIRRWLGSSHTYTLRFAMGMLLSYYLDDAFTPEICRLAAEVSSREYYVQMMQAWFFATALAKQWDTAIAYLLERRLSPWVHGKTIQKAVESYRIAPEQKQYLRTLKLPGGSQSPRRA